MVTVTTSCLVVYLVCVHLEWLRQGYQQNMLYWQRPKRSYYDLQAALVTTEMDRVNCHVCPNEFVFMCVCACTLVCTNECVMGLFDWWGCYCQSIHHSFLSQSLLSLPPLMVFPPSFFSFSLNSGCCLFVTFSNSFVHFNWWHLLSSFRCCRSWTVSTRWSMSPEWSHVTWATQWWQGPRWALKHTPFIVNCCNVNSSDLFTYYCSLLSSLFLT